jgi:HEAT repeat protein
MGAAEASPDSQLQDLIMRAVAIDDEEDHDYWEIVVKLQHRGDPAVLEVMIELCGAASEARQRLGLNVLAQLGYESGRPFLEESLPVVLGLCGPDRPVAVIINAVEALGHLGDPRALAVVLSFSTHDNAKLRKAVDMALPWIAGDAPDPTAVDALIALSSDEDSDVRDWATFGLGQLLDVDSDAIRTALWNRVDDPDGDVAGEALVGLAARGDRLVVYRIAERLEDPDVRYLVVEAAAKIADQALLPALRALRQAGWGDDDQRGDRLNAAIRACEGRA